MAYDWLSSATAIFVAIATTDAIITSYWQWLSHLQNFRDPMINLEFGLLIGHLAFKVEFSFRLFQSLEIEEMMVKASCYD